MIYTKKRFNPCYVGYRSESPHEYLAWVTLQNVSILVMLDIGLKAVYKE